MTRNKEAKEEDLGLQQRLLAQRLQRLADAMANRAIRRHAGVTRADDAENDAAELRAWKETLRRIEEVTAEQERLFQDAGILPKEK
jgi:hypothetical protein